MQDFCVHTVVITTGTLLGSDSRYPRQHITLSVVRQYSRSCEKNNNPPQKPENNSTGATKNKLQTCLYYVIMTSRDWGACPVVYFNWERDMYGKPPQGFIPNHWHLNLNNMARRGGLAQLGEQAIR